MNERQRMPSKLVSPSSNLFIQYIEIRDINLFPNGLGFKINGEINLEVLTIHNGRFMTVYFILTF